MVVPFSEEGYLKVASGQLSVMKLTADDFRPKSRFIHPHTVTQKYEDPP